MKPTLRIVDRVPGSAMLQTSEITAPPVVRIRFPLRTRWALVRHFKPWRTWPEVWRNLRFLLCG